MSANRKNAAGGRAGQSATPTSGTANRSSSDVSAAPVQGKGAAEKGAAEKAPAAASSQSMQGSSAPAAAPSTKASPAGAGPLATAGTPSAPPAAAKPAPAPVPPVTAAPKSADSQPAALPPSAAAPSVRPSAPPAKGPLQAPGSPTSPAQTKPTGQPAASSVAKPAPAPAAPPKPMQAASAPTAVPVMDKPAATIPPASAAKPAVATPAPAPKPTAAAPALAAAPVPSSAASQPAAAALRPAAPTPVTPTAVPTPPVPPKAEASPPQAEPAPVRTVSPAAPPKPEAGPAAAKAAPAAPIPPQPVHVGHDVLAPDGEVNALLAADHRDPFAFLGMHDSWFGGPMLVRAFLPWAKAVTVLDAATGEPVGRLDRLREEGFFAGAIQGRTAWFPYRLRVSIDGGAVDIDDPYRFPPILSESEVHLLAEGSELRCWELLGAHPRRMEGVDGVAFSVWAPHAGRVAVVGDFNDWDGRRHGMRLRHEGGIWEIFLPGLQPGRLYKFEIKTGHGDRLPDKSDPLAFAMENQPGSASVICDIAQYQWRDGDWMAKRSGFVAREQPISIYQMHLGSWRRKPEEGHRWLTYQENADELVGYVSDMGFTHIQLMPVAEYDGEASVGYRPLAPFAPTSRWGTPDQFRLLVDRCHQAGIGVLVDWVPNQFSDNPHGLALFDGTCLYESSDPQQRRRPGGDGLVYDYGRREVASYLVSNALFWLEEYHLDGLRIAGIDGMLYLDYGRARGEWTPNRYGGHENLDAVEFLRRLNEQVYAQKPGIFTVAQENSTWQRISHPTFVGGLGFGFRWNTTWIRDVLRYLSRNPVHRKYYHDELLRGPGGAFQENFLLPMSHEEVSIGRGSILRKMPGDRWQRFANLRTFYALLFVHPGKKLMFMGTEFAQEREWNSDISLDWHMLGDFMHLGVQRLIRDLNALYRSTPALYEQDCEPEGFEWIDCNDSDQSIISFVRKAKDGRGSIVVVFNFTPVSRPNYRLGVPSDGFWQERLNTDAEAYGGGNVGNGGGLEAMHEPMHGRPFSLGLTLPPFAAVVLQHVGHQRG